MVSVLHVPMDSECELSSHACVLGTLGVCCLTKCARIRIVNVYMYICMLPCMPLSVHACLATCSVTHLFWVYILYVYA